MRFADMAMSTLHDDVCTVRKTQIGTEPNKSTMLTYHGDEVLTPTAPTPLPTI
jgi:hypothetical protein